MTAEFEKIAHYDNYLAAETAKSLLESHHLHPRLLTEGTSGWRPALVFSQGITLIVPPSEAPDAREVLSAVASPLPPSAPETLTFREAVPGDLRFLADMNHKLIRDEGHRNPMNVSQLAERMAGFLSIDYHAVIFSFDSADCGYALYRFDPDYVYLRQFYIDPAFRRRGLGTDAFQALLSEKWLSSPRVRIDVLTANHPAIDFWRSLGFDDYCLTMELDR